MPRVFNYDDIDHTYDTYDVLDLEPAYVVRIDDDYGDSGDVLDRDYDLFARDVWAEESSYRI